VHNLKIGNLSIKSNRVASLVKATLFLVQHYSIQRSHPALLPGRQSPVPSPHKKEYRNSSPAPSKALPPAHCVEVVPFMAGQLILTTSTCRLSGAIPPAYLSPLDLAALIASRFLSPRVKAL